MKRVFILLMDSFGVGASDDAKKFGDEGSDTFGHIKKACSDAKGDREGLRQGSLQLPHLKNLGLHAAAAISRGDKVDADYPIEAAYGFAQENSFGKDTPSGHWEIAGVPVMFDWGYFPPEYPSFPEELLQTLIERGKLPGVLGNCHASGTTIIEELGEEHIKTGKPIVYTSADSVFQIAAHEKYFGLQRLCEISEIARELVDKYNIGRVISRPFIGESANDFTRTGNRRDYSTPPPEPTLLQRLKEDGGNVIAIGKTADIFAHQGISENIKADGNMALFDATLKAAKEASDRSLIFTNFVDFDSKYGHRRDVPGYAASLEAFDKRLPEFQSIMQEGDIAIITADHGCDPTWEGSDHTREHIPVLVFGSSIKPSFIGKRQSFADIGQTIAEYLDMKALKNGESFLSLLS